MRTTKENSLKATVEISKTYIATIEPVLREEISEKPIVLLSGKEAGSDLHGSTSSRIEPQ